MPAKNLDKAIRMAITALKMERQRIAFDANLFDLRLACYPKSKAASERRKEIDAAIAELIGQVAINQKPIHLHSAQMELFSE